MSEEKDSEQAKREAEESEEEDPGLPAMKKQIKVSKGVPERKAVARRQERVKQMLHELPQSAQDAIRADLEENHGGGDRGRDRGGAHRDQDAQTQQFPRTNA
jgi:phospholipid/cholesterol/gamma-HCH transport system ATP-binding protein